MLKSSRGMTLIELIIGILIISVLTVMAAPSFSSWIGNTKIRGQAESLSTGLQLARAEALKINGKVSFQLVSELDATCTLENKGTNWVVSRDSVAGQCDSSKSDETPFIVQKHDGKENAGRVQVIAGQNTYTFNGLGRLTDSSNIDVYGAEGEDGCVHKNGALRCLRIEISAGGNIRMCDPALPKADARGCKS